MPMSVHVPQTLFYVPGNSFSMPQIPPYRCDSSFHVHQNSPHFINFETKQEELSCTAGSGGCPKGTLLHFRDHHAALWSPDEIALHCN